MIKMQICRTNNIYLTFQVNKVNLTKIRNAGISTEEVTFCTFKMRQKFIF